MTDSTTAAKAIPPGHAEWLEKRDRKRKARAELATARAVGLRLRQAQKIRHLYGKGQR